MTRTHTVVVAVAAVITSTATFMTFAGCSGALRQSPPPSTRDGAPVVAGQPAGPVIVRLVSRHGAITVTSSSSGPRFSAQTSDGSPIVANATLEQLRTGHPEVYRTLEPGIAVDTGADRDPLFAGVPSMEPVLLLDASVAAVE